MSCPFSELIFGHHSAHFLNGLHSHPLYGFFPLEDNFLNGIFITAETQRTRKSRLAEPQTLSGVFDFFKCRINGFFHIIHRDAGN